MTPTATGRLQCVTGLVIIPPSRLLGATNGILVPFFGGPIVLRQVIVPSALNGTPLAQLNRQIADVCGNFIVDRGQLLLNVIFAQPSVRGTRIGATAGMGTTTDLGAVASTALAALARAGVSTASGG